MGHAFSFTAGFMILAMFHSFMTASVTLLVILLLINVSMYVNNTCMVVIVPVLLLTLEIALDDGMFMWIQNELKHFLSAISRFLKRIPIEHVE